LKRLLAGRMTLIMSAFSSRSFRLVGVVGRLSVGASEAAGLRCPPPGGRWPAGNLPSLARRVPPVPPVDILGPEQSVSTWLTPCAPTSKISTVMPPAPRPRVDGLRPARQATVSTPSQCHEAARKFSGTPCREAR